MNSAAELNRLLLQFVMLCQVDIQECSRENSVTFNFLGIIWENKRSWENIAEWIFQAFKKPKIQHFGNHGATSGIYWVYYKPPVLSYLEVISTFSTWRSLRDPHRGRGIMTLTPQQKSGIFYFIFSSLFNTLTSIIYMHIYIYIYIYICIMYIAAQSSAW